MRRQLFLIGILACCALVNCQDRMFQSDENNRYFIMPAKKYTWQESLKECESRHMDLLTIESETKAKEIKKLLEKVFTGKPIPRFYLAANDLQKFRQFVWITSHGREPFTYTNWERNEPNNYMKLNERCVHIGFHGTDQWNDSNCNRKYGFICQEIFEFGSLLNAVPRA